MKNPTTIGERLRLFGVVILITKQYFTSRPSLWSTTASYKYMNPPALGKTGMAHNWFDDLFSCLTWSEQPRVRPANMSQEKIYGYLSMDMLKR